MNIKNVTLFDVFLLDVAMNTQKCKIYGIFVLYLFFNSLNDNYVSRVVFKCELYN